MIGKRWKWKVLMPPPIQICKQSREVAHEKPWGTLWSSVPFNATSKNKENHDGFIFLRRGGGSKEIEPSIDTRGGFMSSHTTSFYTLPSPRDQTMIGRRRRGELFPMEWGERIEEKILAHYVHVAKEGGGTPHTHPSLQGDDGVM